MNPAELKILSGSSNRPLAEKIGQALRHGLSKTDLTQFLDGETFVRIGENIRGQDLFIIQSTCGPVNDHLMQLLILIDAAKRANTGRINVVIPYFGYARQDRKTHGREPITAKLVANLLETAGANRIITLDLHSGQIQGFFDIPVDNLLPDPLFAPAVRRELSENTVVVAPDVGATKRAGALAKRLNAELAVIHKHRPRPNESTVLNVIGDVNGKNCVLFDDIADTCGTLANAAKALQASGAKKIVACVTHGLLSGDAVQKLDESPIHKIFITDSIPIGNKSSPKIEIISVADLLAKAISYTHNNESVSSLFE